jgi:hypothetical protein
MKLVVVKVKDIATHDGWTIAEELDKIKPVECIVSGLLIKEDEDFIRVCLLMRKDKLALGTWIDIPTGCVDSIDYIKEIDWDES